MSYKVTIEVSKMYEESIIFNSYKEARSHAQGASTLARLMEWTRHPRVEGVVEIEDYYSDVYNEGSITVERTSSWG